MGVKDLIGSFDGDTNEQQQPKRSSNRRLVDGSSRSGGGSAAVGAATSKTNNLHARLQNIKKNNKHSRRGAPAGGVVSSNSSVTSFYSVQPDTDFVLGSTTAATAASKRVGNRRTVSSTFTSKDRDVISNRLTASRGVTTGDTSTMTPVSRGRRAISNTFASGDRDTISNRLTRGGGSGGGSDLSPAASSRELKRGISNRSVVSSAGQQRRLPPKTVDNPSHKLSNSSGHSESSNSQQKMRLPPKTVDNLSHKNHTKTLGNTSGHSETTATTANLSSGNVTTTPPRSSSSFMSRGSMNDHKRKKSSSSSFTSVTCVPSVDNTTSVNDRAEADPLATTSTPPASRQIPQPTFSWEEPQPQTSQDLQLSNLTRKDSHTSRSSVWSKVMRSGGSNGGSSGNLVRSRSQSMDQNNDTNLDAVGNNSSLGFFLKQPDKTKEGSIADDATPGFSIDVFEKTTSSTTSKFPPQSFSAKFAASSSCLNDGDAFNNNHSISGFKRNNSSSRRSLSNNHMSWSQGLSCRDGNNSKQSSQGGSQRKIISIQPSIQINDASTSKLITNNGYDPFNDDPHLDSDTEQEQQTSKNNYKEKMKDEDIIDKNIVNEQKDWWDVHNTNTQQNQQSQQQQEEEEDPPSQDANQQPHQQQQQEEEPNIRSQQHQSPHIYEPQQQQQISLSSLPPPDEGDIIAFLETPDTPPGENSITIEDIFGPENIMSSSSDAPDANIKTTTNGNVGGSGDGADGNKGSASPTKHINGCISKPPSELPFCKTEVIPMSIDQLPSPIPIQQPIDPEEAERIRKKQVKKYMEGVKQVVSDPFKVAGNNKDAIPTIAGAGGGAGAVDSVGAATTSLGIGNSNGVGIVGMGVLDVTGAAAKMKRIKVRTKKGNGDPISPGTMQKAVMKWQQLHGGGQPLISSDEDGGSNGDTPNTIIRKKKKKVIRAKDLQDNHHRRQRGRSVGRRSDGSSGGSGEDAGEPSRRKKSVGPSSKQRARSKSKSRRRSSGDGGGEESSRQRGMERQKSGRSVANGSGSRRDGMERQKSSRGGGENMARGRSVDARRRVSPERRSEAAAPDGSSNNRKTPVKGARSKSVGRPSSTAAERQHDSGGGSSRGRPKDATGKPATSSSSESKKGLSRSKSLGRAVSRRSKSVGRKSSASGTEEPTSPTTPSRSRGGQFIQAVKNALSPHRKSPGMVSQILVAESQGVDLNKPSPTEDNQLRNKLQRTPSQRPKTPKQQRPLPLELQEALEKEEAGVPMSIKVPPTATVASSTVDQSSVSDIEPNETFEEVPVSPVTCAFAESPMQRRTSNDDMSEVSNEEMFRKIKGAGVTEEMLELLYKSGLVIAEGH